MIAGDFNIHTRRGRSRYGAFKGGRQVQILEIIANDFICDIDYSENKVLGCSRAKQTLSVSYNLLTTLYRIIYDW